MPTAIRRPSVWLSMLTAAIFVPRTAAQTEAAADIVLSLSGAIDKLESRLLDFISYLPLLAIAGVIVVVFFVLSRWIAGREQPFNRLIGNSFLQDLARSIVRLSVLVVGLLLALEVLDAVALVGAVLGTAGVVGLAVGFAFRDLVENYIASVLLSLRQPFAPDDVVQIGDHTGKVVRLTSRATILMTFEGNHLRIPNAQVFKGTILNYSHNPLRRFEFEVGVGTEVDLLAAQRLGLDVLGKMEGVVTDPKPSALIKVLGDSTVVLTFYGWVDQRQSGLLKVRGEAMRRIKTAFDEAGLAMPEPTYRVSLIGQGPALAVGETKSVPPRKLATAESEPHAETDLSADDQLDRQIAADRAASGGDEDLLDAKARRE